MTDWTAVTTRARELGLEDRFDEGHALLDTIPVDVDVETAVRVALERGRLFRSAGDLATASMCFDDAVGLAASAGLDGLQVDALHMVALVAPVEEQLEAHQRALDLAQSSADVDARRWVASLLNNIGMTHADLGEWDAALSTFEAALDARRALQGEQSEETRIAKWMVAWALRNLGRRDEALALQTALKTEFDALGLVDPYVDEELGLLA